MAYKDTENHTSSEDNHAFKFF